jgi:hypothetical protein
MALNGRQAGRSSAAGGDAPPPRRSSGRRPPAARSFGGESRDHRSSLRLPAAGAQRQAQAPVRGELDVGSSLPVGMTRTHSAEASVQARGRAPLLTGILHCRDRPLRKRRSRSRFSRCLRPRAYVKSGRWASAVRMRAAEIHLKVNRNGRGCTMEATTKGCLEILRNRLDCIHRARSRPGRRCPRGWTPRRLQGS